MLSKGLRKIGITELVAVLMAVAACLTVVMALGKSASAEVVPGYYNSQRIVSGNTANDVDTGIVLRAGDRVVVSASGEINPGCFGCTGVGPAGGGRNANADWPLPGQPEYSLIGKAGGQYFYIGSGKTWIHQGGSDKLFLYINDIWTSDNSGQFVANIRVDRDVPLPETTINSGPSGLVNTSAATFGFSGSSPDGGVRFECSLDGAGFAPCSSPKSYFGLGNGQHTFRVRAVDRFNRPDPTPESRGWIVDTVPPETTITSGPSGTVHTKSARFEFLSAEPGSRFECSLDGGAFEPCSSPKEYASLSIGGHTFRVKATDAAGNVDPTPAVRDWTVEDNSPPEIVFVKPTGKIRDRTPLISAVVRDAETELTQGNITLEVDGVSKPFFTYDVVTDRLTYQSSRLSYGLHTVRVEATDGELGASESWSFRVVKKRR